MRNALFKQSITGSKGEARQQWTLDQPFQDVFRQVASQLTPSTGWKTKGSQVTGPVWFYANASRKAVYLCDGVLNGENPVMGTQGSVTTIVTEGY